MTPNAAKTSLTVGESRDQEIEQQARQGGSAQGIKLLIATNCWRSLRICKSLEGYEIIDGSFEFDTHVESGPALSAVQRRAITAPHSPPPLRRRGRVGFGGAAIGLRLPGPKRSSTRRRSSALRSTAGRRSRSHPAPSLKASTSCSSQLPG